MAYEKLRDDAITAAAEGAMVQATQLAMKMNNLIPNGKSIYFSPVNGNVGNTINVLVREAVEGGKPTAAFTMTRQQFMNYLKGPASTLDGVVELGVEKSLAMAGQQVGLLGQRETQPPSTSIAKQSFERAQQYENLRAAAMAAAGQGAVREAAQLATKMNDLIPNGKSVRFIPQSDGTVGALVRDVNAGRPVAAFKMTPEQFSNYLKGPASTLDGMVELGAEKALASAGKQVPLPGQRTQLPSADYQRAMEDYKLRKRAYDAFPYEDQRAQRARYLERLLRDRDAPTDQGRYRDSGACKRFPNLC